MFGDQRTGEEGKEVSELDIIVEEERMGLREFSYGDQAMNQPTGTLRH